MSRKDEATLWSNYTKLLRLLDNYPKYFKVDADRVGLKEMQQIRMSLRGKTAVFREEVNIIRRAINSHIGLYTELLLNCIGGIAYTYEEFEVEDKLLESIVCAPAVAGRIAPLSVIIPAHNTGLSTEKISFFQALSIPTKISNGTIEIINDVHILKPGDKVKDSEATLLNMLSIPPFFYGLIVEQPENLRVKFMAGIANLASIFLSIGYPTVASAPGSIANGFKNLLAIAVVTDVEFAEAATIKDLNKFATAAATVVAASASAAGDTTAVEKKEEKKEESESEDDDMGFVLLSYT
ncbi:hypothetical protein ACFW04_002521 [Cataglyphis niger]